jgi:hypothetical protein
MAASCAFYGHVERHRDPEADSADADGQARPALSARQREIHAQIVCTYCMVSES